MQWAVLALAKRATLSNFARFSVPSGVEVFVCAKKDKQLKEKEKLVGLFEGNVRSFACGLLPYSGLVEYYRLRILLSASFTPSFVGFHLF